MPARARCGPRRRSVDGRRRGERSRPKRAWSARSARPPGSHSLKSLSRMVEPHEVPAEHVDLERGLALELRPEEVAELERSRIARARTGVRLCTSQARITTERSARSTAATNAA